MGPMSSGTGVKTDDRRVGELAEVGALMLSLVL